jgi:EAL domain-containing protein (putative c-di-GMP-specific phosphodiesterase class I)
VEDETTLNALKKIGVDFVQGYHCSRPEAIENVYQQNRQRWFESGTSRVLSSQI